MFEYRRVTTHCGFRFDEFKSALQKTIRRGDEDNLMTWIIEEIALFPVLAAKAIDKSDGDAKKKISRSFKSVMTNIVNRLRCASYEDLSPRCVKDFVTINQCLDEYVACGYRNIRHLSRACWFLVDAKKLRICSHLRMASHPKGAVIKPTTYKYEEEGIVHQLGELIKHAQQFQKCNDEDKAWLRIEASFLLADLYRKVFELEKDQHVDCIKTSTIKRKKEGFQAFWQLLMREAYNNNNNTCDELPTAIQIKREFFETRAFFGEQFMCLCSAIESLLAVIFGKELSAQPERDNNLMITTSSTQHAKPRILPRYIYDRHVRGGNTSLNFFISEGAMVTNEDKEWGIVYLKSHYDEMRSKFEPENNKKRKLVEKEESSSSLSPSKSSLLRDFVSQLEWDDVKTKYNILYNCTPNSKKGVVLKVGKGLDVLVLKEMTKSVNYGLDQWLAHRIKRDNIFELPELHSVEMVKMLKSQYHFDRNMGEFTATLTNQAFFLTNLIGEAKSDARFTHHDKSRCQQILKTKNGLLMMMAILIYRTLLGLTDTNFSNILVDVQDRLYSVDENFIFRYTPTKLLNCKSVQRILNHLLDYHDKDDMLACIPHWIKHEGVKRDEIVKKMVGVLGVYFDDDVEQILRRNIEELYTYFQIKIE